MNGKYGPAGGYGQTLREAERSRERAAAGHELPPSAVLHVSASADDPPLNGEPFWYRTDLTCGDSQPVATQSPTDAGLWVASLGPWYGGYLPRYTGTLPAGVDEWGYYQAADEAAMLAGTWENTQQPVAAGGLLFGIAWTVGYSFSDPEPPLPPAPPGYTYQ